MKKSVMVAMSGGVDSSVAASLLIDKGYAVRGATMKLFTGEKSADGNAENEKRCASDSAASDAKAVADKMGFEHFVFDFGEEFRNCVIDKFIDSYICGKTPNPCIECNRHIKFSKMLKSARELGSEFIATGHYAQIEYDLARERYVLKKAADVSKDQTYVLYSMTQDELAHTLLPLGALLKSDVRKIAEEKSLINAKKPDSQDICFVPDGDYGAFIEITTGKVFEKGDFVDCKGNVLGKHKGIINYTIGQRKGLGIAFGEPMYVVGKNATDNTITLGKHEELFCIELTASDANWIMIENLCEPMRVKAKTRYKQPETPATIYPLENGRLRCVFDEPQRAITSGQAVVFYDGDYVVGGATIE